MKAWHILITLCSIALLANAQETFDARQNDLKVLNYALTLENLEATFYTEGLTNFTAQQFADAGYGTGSVYLYFQMIMHHEIAHVTTLRSVITTLGGNPVPACHYNFGIKDVATFVSLAQVFENVGVMAYDGAISSITSGPLQTAAATIATVEARHAAYLNELTQRIPFPDAFDNATLPSVIAGIIAPFLQNCSSTVQLPLVPPTATQIIICGDFNSTRNDIKALNYALTLEHLEATFYRMGMEKFSVTDFEAAGYNSTVHFYFTLITAHEAAHVQTISAAITALGGDAVQECQYLFNDVLQNVTSFVAGAQVFENVGVTAYNGAVNTITNGMIQTVAATIATVEARHAAYLNELVGLNPFPYSFDNATEPTVIVNTISGFLGTCPGPELQLPVLPSFRQQTNSAPNSQTPSANNPSGSPMTTPTNSPMRSPSATPRASDAMRLVASLILVIVAVLAC